jgi:hypothetical protein
MVGGTAWSRLNTVRELESGCTKVTAVSQWALRGKLILTTRANFRLVGGSRLGRAQREFRPRLVGGCEHVE